MKKTKTNDPDILDEYDFSKGVRGRYAKKNAEGTNVVVLQAEVAKVFPNSESVNEALKTLIRLSQPMVAASGKQHAPQEDQELEIPDPRENLLETIREREGPVNRLQLIYIASRDLLTETERDLVMDEYLRVGHLRNFLKHDEEGS